MNQKSPAEVLCEFFSQAPRVALWTLLVALVALPFLGAELVYYLSSEPAAAKSAEIGTGQIPYLLIAGLVGGAACCLMRIPHKTVRQKFQWKWFIVFIALGGYLAVVAWNLAHAASFFSKYLYFSVVGLVLLLAIFAGFISYPKLFCDKCGKHIETLAHWICGFCDERHEPSCWHSFLNRCGKCGKQPRAIRCPHCQHLVRLIHGMSVEHVATLIVKYKSAPRIQSETVEQTTEKKWAKEREDYRIETERNRLKAELEKAATELAKQKTARRLHEAMIDPKANKPQTEREKAAETIARQKDAFLSWDEVFAEEEAKAQAILDPDLRQRTVEVLKRIREEHGMR